MRNIYIGYSTSLTADQLIGYFDIDPEHESRISKFEQVFGCDYIEPGKFEVYDRFEYESFGFDRDLFSKLVPFTPDPDLVSLIDFSSAKSVFYVETPKLSNMENEEVTLFGPMGVEKYDFE